MLDESEKDFRLQPHLAPRSLSDALSDRTQQKAQEIGSKSARASNVRFCPCDVFARQHCTSNVTQNGTRMILCCAFFTSSCCITNCFRLVDIRDPGSGQELLLHAQQRKKLLQGVLREARRLGKRWGS